MSATNHIARALVSDADTAAVMVGFGVTKSEARILVLLAPGREVEDVILNAAAVREGCDGSGGKVKWRNLAKHIARIRGKTTLIIKNVYGRAYMLSEASARCVRDEMLRSQELTQQPAVAHDIRGLRSRGFSSQAIAAMTGMTYAAVEEALA